MLSPTLSFVGSKKHAVAFKLFLTEADHHYLLLYFQQKTWGNKGTLTSTRTSLCWKPAIPCTSLPASASVLISQVQRSRRKTAYHLCMSASTSIIRIFSSEQMSIQKMPQVRMHPLALPLFGHFRESQACSLLLTWAEHKGQWPQHRFYTAPHALSNPSSWKHSWSSISVWVTLSALK